MKMKNLVEESFDEYIKHNLILKEDVWDMEEEPMELEKIEDVSIDDEIMDMSELVKALNNELNSPEFNRVLLNFKLMSTGEEISGITMAKLSNGNSFLFKTENGLRKINVDDIILESKKA